MDNLLAIIAQIRERSYIKSFIEHHGLINDKILAIQAIIINPYAIELLSPTLRHDPEVLIYWYPLTVEKNDSFDHILMIEEEGVSDELLGEKYWSTNFSVSPRIPEIDIFLHGDHKSPNITPGVSGLGYGKFKKIYQAVLTYLLTNSQIITHSEVKPSRLETTAYTINHALIQQAVEQFSQGEKEYR